MTLATAGNRTAARFGGDEWGENLREVVYASNLLNQYVHRGVSSGVDIMGYAPEQSTVTVNGLSAYRFVEFFQRLVSWANDAAARYEEVLIGIDPGDDEMRMVFLPRTPEAFTHDADGGLLSDGRWVYEWDGENRLSAMETRAGLPSGVPVRRVEFTYDFLGRRCVKRVYGPDPTPVGGGVQNAGSGGTPAPGPNPQPTWSLISTTKFVWDGWTVAAELDGNDAVVRTFAWGSDVSGREQGAGGVGGLLFQTEGPNGPTRHALYDGNGNVTSMRDDAGAVAAAFEYGPFGETLTARGDAVGSTPFRFSTKYTDPESGLLYYGHRYYNPSTGRWLSRDPIDEHDGPNLYAFVGNEPVGRIDPIGLWRYLAGGGMFSGSFGPSANTSALMSSDMELMFTPNAQMLDGCGCTEVKFVQIHWYNSNGLVLGIGSKREWHLDAGRSTRPYYPNATAGMPPNRPAIMHDAPRIPSSYNSWSIQKFETCAVCSSPDANRGEIYGCISWQHEFVLQGSPKTIRHQGRDLTGSGHNVHWSTAYSYSGKQQLSDGRIWQIRLGPLHNTWTYHFREVTGRFPTQAMMRVLNRYFY